MSEVSERARQASRKVRCFGWNANTTAQPDPGATIIQAAIDEATAEKQKRIEDLVAAKHELTMRLADAYLVTAEYDAKLAAAREAGLAAVRILRVYGNHLRSCHHWDGDGRDCSCDWDGALGDAALAQIGGEDG